MITKLRVEELNAKMNGSFAQFKSAQGEYMNDKFQLEDALAELYNVTTVDTQDLRYTAWKCESAFNPIDKCFYDGDNDPAHDSCVMCGQPEERK
jgi:hypothetical protein